MQRPPVKTQCFAHFGISCELGNRKQWDERRMQHLPVKTHCFLQFGTVDGRNIQTASIRYNPLAPKVQC